MSFYVAHVPKSCADAVARAGYKIGKKNGVTVNMNKAGLERGSMSSSQFVFFEFNINARYGIGQPRARSKVAFVHGLRRMGEGGKFCLIWGLALGGLDASNSQTTMKQYICSKTSSFVSFFSAVMGHCDGAIRL